MNDEPDFTPPGTLELRQCGQEPSEKRWEPWFGGCLDISGRP